MSAFADAELLAVARVVWPHVSHDYAHFRAATLHGLSYAWLSYGTESVREFAVRLALAYPTKAGEALGPGWRATSPTAFRWSYGDSRAPEFRMYGDAEATHTIEVWSTGEVLVMANDEYLCPPEFDAALSRARLIAAAWTRIEAGSKRDPARPYCREPETCGGSCRRDPACNS